MLRFNQTKVAKKEFYGVKKKTKKTWDVDVNNMVFSKLIKTKDILSI